MHEQEARLILQAYRPGGQDQNDPHFAEALQETVRNSELGRWFAEEQAFDQAIAAHLEKMPAPFGLKTRILAHDGTPTKSWAARWTIGWRRLPRFFFYSRRSLACGGTGLRQRAPARLFARDGQLHSRAAAARHGKPGSREDQELARTKGTISAEVPPRPGVARAGGLPHPFVPGPRCDADLFSSGRRIGSRTSLSWIERPYQS